MRTGALNMTRLAIIFSLLFASPAWAGEVDGNSFLCTTVNFGYQAISFEKGKVYVHYHDKKITADYTAANEHVIWAKNFGANVAYRMSRKTLIVEVISVRDNEVMYTDTCEFMELTKAIRVVIEEKKRKDLRERKGNKF